MAATTTHAPAHHTVVFSPQENNNTLPSCDRYYFENRTYFLYNKYEGIPETLLINVVGWLALLILFIFLRKIAWDYGRIALVSRTEENRKKAKSGGPQKEVLVSSSPEESDISHEHHGNRVHSENDDSPEVVVVNRNLLAEGENRYNVWTTLFYGDHDRHSIGSQESLDTTLRMQDKGIFAWIPAFFRIKDADILRKCGHDAIQYIQFQRYLLVYLSIICVLSVAIILPVNISDSNSNGSEFADTTISNVKPESPLLWIHAVFAVVYLLIAVYFMRRFSTNLEYDEDEQVSRTLMISNIPKDKCFRSIMMEYFQEAYPEAVIIDVQFAYNISKLVSLDASRQRASEARKMSELMFKKTQVQPIIRPYTCGRCCCCCSCCGCKEANAIEYYTEEERVLREGCESEKAQAFQEPLGIAFVTLDADHMAAKIRADFRASCKGAHNPQMSSVYDEINVASWTMKYAPAPENIYWENLSLKEWKWWLRAIFLNLILVILLFFFTTPTIIMNSLDELNFKKNLQKSHSPVLVSFLPTILLWTFSALLPNVVYYSDQFVGHWTKTAEHHSVMRKTFIFLLLMVLILPSLGLTSAKALFEWVVIDTTGSRKYRWECIFLAGNGAFFVNYVITSAFIGTALELIRFSQLFMYALKLMCSRSAAEKSTVRKSVVWDFEFGIQYAWMLCVFAIIMAYSIPCPLVMPFGMVYIGLKHLVDRYNIYFAYAPSKIDKNIHTSAVTFVIAAVIFLQLSIVFFSALRTVELSVNPVFIFSAVALFITLVVYFGRIFFGWFKGLSPIKYKNAGSFKGLQSPNDENEPFNNKSETDGILDKSFVPSVLTESAMEEQPPDVNTFTYGSTGSVNMSEGPLDSG